MVMAKPDSVGEKVWKAAIKNLSSDDRDEIERMDAENLKSVIAGCEENVATIESQQEMYAELKQLEGKVKAIKAAFTDAKNRQRGRQRYAALVMEEKGYSTAPLNDRLNAALAALAHVDDEVEKDASPPPPPAATAFPGSDA